jgi:signal transduction histidine kinase
MAAKEKNIYLTYTSDGQLPQVVADEDKIKEVLINLIGNAQKFTSLGGINIQTKVDGDFVVISVEDTGTGIHQEDFDLLFKKFSQVKQKFVKSLGGSGLGLYICRKIIEGLGGKIWLTSEVGKGTKFYFTLPIAK